MNFTNKEHEFLNSLLSTVHKYLLSRSCVLIVSINLFTLSVGLSIRQLRKQTQYRARLNFSSYAKTHTSAYDTNNIMINRNNKTKLSTPRPRFDDTTFHHKNKCQKRVTQQTGFSRERKDARETGFANAPSCTVENTPYR